MTGIEEEQNRIQKAVKHFQQKHPNDTNVKLRVGSGRVIIESDKHKIEY